MEDKWPVYYSDTVHISNKDSSVAIVCLWTKKERLMEKLNHNSYCFLGQLYSKEYGLLILLRNLLANPHIHHLVVTGIDLNDSSTGLVNFFEKGINSEGFIDGTEVAIDKKITPEHIAAIRKRITLHDLRDRTAQEVNEYVKALTQKDIDETPVFIELPELATPIRYPTDNSGFKIRGKSFSAAYEELLFTILRFGKYIPETRKVILKNVLFFVSGFSDTDMKYLHEYLGEFNKGADSRKTYNGLSKDALNEQEKFPEQKTVFAEKMDCWEGLRQTVKSFAEAEDTEICIMIANAYLDEEKLEDALEAVEKKPRTSAWDPDPHGNLVIRVEENKIKILQIAQDGRTIDSFEGTSAKELYKKIASEKRISLLYHALDIGAELQKAETALKQGGKYVQDRPANSEK